MSPPPIPQIDCSLEGYTSTSFPHVELRKLGTSHLSSFLSFMMSASFWDDPYDVTDPTFVNLLLV